jgi:hypothetical protein
MVVACLLLSACGSRAYLSTEQDPARVPSKLDPVVPMVSDNASIKERQLLPILKRQMQAQGFNVVDNIDSATWVLGLTVGNHSFVASTTSHGLAVPIGNIAAVSRTKMDVNYETDSTLQLLLISTDDIRAGKQKPMWSGTSSSERDVLNDNAPVILKDLLQQYGQNYEDDRMMRFQSAPK